MIVRVKDGVTEWINDGWGGSRALTGAKVYMSDGSVWFHPYNGSRPWRTS
jgi:hypothetical protein